MQLTMMMKNNKNAIKLFKFIHKTFTISVVDVEVFVYLMKMKILLRR